MKKAKLYKPKRKTGVKKFSLKPSSTKQGFDREWSTFRFRYLHHNPNCYACGVHKDNAKIHIDHIITRRHKPEYFSEVTNMMPLCISCHSVVTQKFDRSCPPNTEGKMMWVESKRLETGTTVKIKVIEYKKTKK